MDVQRMQKCSDGPPEREARPQLPITTSSTGETKMKVKSNVKAGGASLNHNQSVAR